MTIRADVAVVGAGPGGAAAALRLASAGCDVVMVDRARFPRPKVCGDGLTPRAIAALSELGVWDRIRSRATIVRDLCTLDLSSGTRRWGPVPGRVVGPHDHGAVVSRRTLDDAIRRAAVEAGARMIEGANVRGVEQDPGRRRVRLHAVDHVAPVDIEANVVIAADGANSRIAELVLGRLPGLLRGVALRQYWRLRASSSFTICVPIGRVGDDLAGYGWVFPVGEETANVGIGIVGDAREIRRHYAEFIDRLGRISKTWRAASPLGRLEGGTLASGLRRKAGAIDGILFVGDAAGVVNPFSGEGIAQAIDSGVAAAHAIVSDPGDRAAIEEHYRHGLARVFPETGRNVEWLPWLVERGGARAREFWCAASRDDRVVTRGARRMALEESLSRRASPDPAMGRVSWERLRVRLRTRRPVLAQFVESIRHELAAPIGDVLAAVHGAIEGEESEITAIDDVIVLSTLMLLLATDATGRAGASDRRPVETLTAWVADSAALGVADLLLAEVFEAFAELQTRWSTALSRAFASAFGDEAVRASRRTGGRREAVLGRWKRALVSAVSSRSTAVVRLR